MQTKHRDIRFEVKTLTADGTFEGLLSPYGNVDQGDDLVERGAFTKSLEQSGHVVPMLWQHNPDSPIGTLTLNDQADGLYCKGAFLLEKDTNGNHLVPDAAKAYALLKSGVIRGLSIGYATVKAQTVNGIRHLKELTLFEGSVVTFPMNLSAGVSTVKTKIPTVITGEILPTRTFKETLAANEATAAAEKKARMELKSKQAEIDALKNTTGEKSLKNILDESRSVQELLKSKSGKAHFTVPNASERKTVVTSAAVGSTASGVLGIDRIPGVATEPRQDLRIRDLFTSRRTSLAMVDFLRVVQPLAPGTMVPQTTPKPENALTFTTASEQIRTIAAFLPATRQVLDDSSELAAFLDEDLGFAVNSTEDVQLLYGDNTGENLHGLTMQAQPAAYTVPIAGTPLSHLDQLGLAIKQLATAKAVPTTFVVLNTADYWDIRLAKDASGRYILGDPQSDTPPMLFNLTTVPTENIAAGTYLVGSGLAPAAIICDREEMTVEIGTSHNDFFITNQVAIRAEKRMALLVKRPDSFVVGTFK